MGAGWLTRDDELVEKDDATAAGGASLFACLSLSALSFSTAAWARVRLVVVPFLREGVLIRSPMGALYEEASQLKCGEEERRGGGRVR